MEIVLNVRYEKNISNFVKINSSKFLFLSKSKIKISNIQNYCGTNKILEEYICYFIIDKNLNENEIILNDEMIISLRFPKKVKISLCFIKTIPEAINIIVKPSPHPLINLKKQIKYFNDNKNWENFNHRFIKIGNTLLLKSDSIGNENNLLLSPYKWFSYSITSINNQKITSCFFEITSKTKFYIEPSPSLILTSKLSPLTFISSEQNCKEIYSFLSNLLVKSNQLNQMKECIILGPNGIGKRTLVLQIASTLQCNFIRIGIDDYSISDTLTLIEESIKALPIIILFDNITDINYNIIYQYTSSIQSFLATKINTLPHSLFKMICVFNIDSIFSPSDSFPFLRLKNYQTSDLCRIQQYLHLPESIILPRGLTFFDCLSIQKSWNALPLSIEEINKIAKQLSQQHTTSIEIPTVRWSDIGGCNGAKKQIKEEVSKILSSNESHGILLYGPPGTGKTLLAKAVATEYNMSFFSVRGAELLSKYVGETEKNIKNLFHTARENSPSIIFFDEIDAIASERKGGSVFDRVVSQILTEMQGVGVIGGILVIGATNRIDKIDKSLLVPGRFDVSVEVGLSCGEERKEVILAQLNSVQHEDINLDQFVSYLPEKISGSDISLIISKAYSLARKEVINRYIKGEVVTTRDIKITAFQLYSSLK
ncbi:AAA family ATPase, putative [Entamoeba histolytica HM-1:IMSS-B]|uniref:AAA family ATPase, putative n=4 Tax=Entamoeba histolytica TaxID=5759 RepID=C4LYV1_ENTH1|nr:AAA family ATPase, putative [Entamoeba histolytica HM-1:IMSS]EAL47677.1 AAA family ATPase, putative [Entamoeba histolytica HM-1:IMSS]EMH77825.1 AAA family ATPase, putative [Entamoeba histolytica HM-1:IMSS-B]ENY60790.1 AAA family ATPase, putative [Entamoeba histolytica HM-1:IMSS-A]GAT94017.1 AAA family ATPase putative [Entamoeba histolytica]|eukprot:XP_653066.1 AAA family ATPase, putative [Entamoeba histolytica HM-1:IMSS]